MRQPLFQSSRSRLSGPLVTLALVALLTQAGSALPALSAQEPPRYTLDPQHVTAAFLVEHIGFAKVLGSFRDVEGTFRFDEATGTVSDVRVVIPTASVDTGVEARDRHLRSADFFDVESHPEMVFESEGTTLDETRRGTLEGTLTILGESRPVTLDVVWNKSGLSPLEVDGEKPYVLGASARGELRRSDYGMTYGLADLLVGDEVELILELEARRDG